MDMDRASPTLMYVVILVLILIAAAYFAYMMLLPSTECKNMDKLWGTIDGKIRPVNVTDPLCKHRVRDYYIKTAYNACSGGAYKNDYVDICNLKSVLKQGVRCLDFEIYSVNDQPVVATSSTNNYFVKETYNSVGFADVMNTLQLFAFGTAGAPNASDPLFLHLRFRSNNTAMYKNLAKLLNQFSRFLLDSTYSFGFHGKNFGTVPLIDLMGKIVIVVSGDNNAFREIPEFFEFVNVVGNSMYMRAIPYYDIAYTPDIEELTEFNRTGMTIGMPDKGANPPNPSGIVMRECGVQFLAMRFQLNDTNLQESNAFFDLAGYAFVLKPERLRAEKNETEFERPPPQNPSLSYATRQVANQYTTFEI